MAFEKESKYGVIKIVRNSLHLYTTQTSYSIINIGFEIKDARWQTNELLVYLAKGKVRKYKTQTSYSSF